MSADREYVLSQRVRAQKSVLADVSIHTLWLRNLMKDTSEESFLYKFKFGVTGCQNNCLKAEENDVGIKGGMTVECSHDDCIQCGVCVKACREGALSMENGRIAIDRDKCNNCARCVKSCPTDAWKGTPGYIVSFGGLFGNHIYKGEQLVPIIRDKETLFRVTDAAISFFEKHANGGERFRLTLQRVGEEEFKKDSGSIRG